MPKNINREQVNFGEIIFGWEVDEYEQHVRDRRWYIVMGTLAFLLLSYAVISSNYLFALILILFGIVMFLQDMKEPLKVKFAITQTGIILGEKYYPFSEIKDFWVIYEPPMIKNLYFSTDKIFKHRLSIPLMDIDPRPVRDYLNDYLEENLEEEEEPLSERIARVFKL